MKRKDALLPATTKEVIDFFESEAVSRDLPDVTGDDPLQGISLKSETEAVVKEGRKCKNDGTDEDFDAFLSVNVGICISGRNVGPHLTKNQIFRHHLLNPDQLQKLTPPSELTHGRIIDPWQDK